MPTRKPTKATRKTIPKPGPKPARKPTRKPTSKPTEKPICKTRLIKPSLESVIPLPTSITDRVPPKVWQEIAAQTLNNYSLELGNDKWLFLSRLSRNQANNINSVSEDFEKGIKTGLRRYFSGRLRIDPSCHRALADVLRALPLGGLITQFSASLTTSTAFHWSNSLVESLGEIHGLQAFVMTAETQIGANADVVDSAKSNTVIKKEKDVWLKRCCQLQTETGKRLPGVQRLAACIVNRKWDIPFYIE